MRVEVDVKCMQGNFGGCGLFGFGDITTFQIFPSFLFRPWTIKVPVPLYPYSFMYSSTINFMWIEEYWTYNKWSHSH